MLSKPSAGWTTFKLNGFEAYGSYLEDIPVQWLQICLFGLTNYNPIVVKLDEEGSEVYITVTENDTYIIAERSDKAQFTTISDFGIFDFATALVEDIEKHLDDWINWDCGIESDDESAKKERKKTLTTLLQEIKKANNTKQ